MYVCVLCAPVNPHLGGRIATNILLIKLMSTSIPDLDAGKPVSYAWPVSIVMRGDHLPDQAEPELCRQPAR